jgi:hypothetical protein
MNSASDGDLGMHQRYRQFSHHVKEIYVCLSMEKKLDGKVPSFNESNDEQQYILCGKSIK